MRAPVLVLVGIPGAGKSAVGRLLAVELGQPLVEVDALIEADLGQPIGEYLAGADESGYRAAELRATLAALSGPGVVALPGGAVEHRQVRAALQGLRVVWLQASITTVTRRLGMHSLGLATLSGIRRTLQAQLDQRAGWYQAVATEVIDTDRARPAEVAAQISRGGD